MTRRRPCEAVLFANNL